ncbi:MAG: filamentous hemagglutinin N-terminal domain-containing protein, partial [Comamonadaceae bacterium]
MNIRRTFPASRLPRLRPLALSLACIGLAPAGAQIVPTGPTFPVNGGTVSVGAATALGNGGLAMGINQASLRAIINWQSFSIGAKDQVNIQQQMGASSVLLNRVANGGPRSEIQGLLSAPGSVYVINPAGVLFGPTAQVNVGGLVASALGMTTSDSDFINGSRQIEFGGAAQDSVVNEGTLNIAQGGTAALIGNVVLNRGTIRADGGTVALAAGGKVVVDFAGDGLTTLRVSPGPDGVAGNVSGTLQADGGRVVMMGAAATNAEGSGGVVNFRGLIRANSLGTRNGEVVLDAGDAAEGVNLTGGTISAAGVQSGQRGGDIRITGRTIGMASFDAGGVFTNIPPPAALGSDDNGLIDANGASGGGRVLLNATAVGGIADTGAIAVASGTRIQADATASGNGGDVRLMAERTLRAFGSVSARGGPEGGDGGFIETSGGYALPASDINQAGLGGGFDVSGIAIDAGAPRGKAGTWLIDPYDIDIVSGVGPGTVPLNPFEPLGNSTIQDGDINAALLTSNVTITTGVGGPPFAGDIVFDDAQIVYTGAADRTFRLDANRSIRGNGDTSIAAYDPAAGTPSGRLNVVFNANANNNAATTGGGQVSYDGTLYTNGGDVTMNGSWANTSNQATSVHLGAGSVVDTRRGNQSDGEGGYTGGSNALAGGNVTLVGRTFGTPDFSQAQAATWLDNTVVTTSTGNVNIFGSSTMGSGVQVENTQGIGGVFTTAGNIQITGIGSYTANSATLYGHGVVLGNTAFVTTSGQPTLQTTSGNIDVSGLRLAGGAQPGTGVLVGNRSLVTTTGGGNISITGEAQDAGAG